MLAYLIIAALMGALIYLLHRQGIAVSKCIIAALFVFRPGKQADRVALDSCTGWIQHVGRFRRNRTYEFRLEYQLSAGSAEVTLLDHQKRELLRLNQDDFKGKIELHGSSRYYLRWDFKNATGRCKLLW